MANTLGTIKSILTHHCNSRSPEIYFSKPPPRTQKNLAIKLRFELDYYFSEKIDFFYPSGRLNWPRPRENGALVAISRHRSPPVANFFFRASMQWARRLQPPNNILLGDLADIKRGEKALPYYLAQKVLDSGVWLPETNSAEFADIFGFDSRKTKNWFYKWTSKQKHIWTNALKAAKGLLEESEEQVADLLDKFDAGTFYIESNFLFKYAK